MYSYTVTKLTNGDVSNGRKGDDTASNQQSLRSTTELLNQGSAAGLMSVGGTVERGAGTVRGEVRTRLWPKKISVAGGKRLLVCFEGVLGKLRKEEGRTMVGFWICFFEFLFSLPSAPDRSLEPHLGRAMYLEVPARGRLWVGKVAPLYSTLPWFKNIV